MAKRGPKGPHSGSWKPGQSGNPSGVSKSQLEIRKLVAKKCSGNILKAMEYFARIAADDAETFDRRQVAFQTVAPYCVTHAQPTDGDDAKSNTAGVTYTLRLVPPSQEANGNVSASVPIDAGTEQAPS